MSDAELRAAAERVLRDERPLVDGHVPVATMLAAKKLATAFLAETDPTEITEAWLLSIGFRFYDFQNKKWYSIGTSVMVLANVQDGWLSWNVCNAYMGVNYFTTRGELIKLCRALKIETKGA